MDHLNWGAAVAIAAVAGTVILNELVSFILNEVFNKAYSRLPSITNAIRNKKREEFYKVTTSKDYKVFSNEFMKRYYGETFFTSVSVGKMMKSYPVYLYYAGKDLEDSSKGIRSYDNIMELDNFSFDEREHQGYKKNHYYRQYHNIVGKNIKGPDRPGYMLDHFLLEEDRIKKIKVSVGTYAENVYSTHVLEYELFKLFKRFKKVTKENWGKIEKAATIRNKMHEGVKHDDVDAMKKSLASCAGRKSLLGVQMLVLMKDNTGRYQVKIIQRSNDVAIAPGIFQLVPSGGFEILNDSEPGYSDYEIRDNLSPGCAVFREFLEELFGIEEFEGQGKGSVNEALLKDSRIKEIEELIRNGKADFKFLGSVIELSGLRHELSFALVIDDEKYEENHQFLGNNEARSKTFISDIYFDNFEQKDEIWRELHGPSAVMWKMFVESPYSKRLLSKEQ